MAWPSVQAAAAAAPPRAARACARSCSTPAGSGRSHSKRLMRSGDGPAPAVDLVGFARAFNAAWNDHDVEGVVAFFAPDATVRQTRAVVALGDAGASTAPVIEDVYGAGPRPFAD